MKTLYKFLRTGMKSQYGNCTWKVGEWKHEDVISLCSQGFHASERIMNALSCVPGEILAQVEVRGNHFYGTDKQVWTDMRVVKAWHWTKEDSVALSIFAADLVIDLYEQAYPEDKRPRKAIEATHAYLKNPSFRTARAVARAAARAAEATRAAARTADAARAAARATRAVARTAETAVWAAETAVRTAETAVWAAETAARTAETAVRTAEAARAAARAAGATRAVARTEIFDEINNWMVERISSLKEVA